MEPITLLTCRDAAALVQRSHTTILRWVKSGKLEVEARTPSGILLFKPHAVLDATKPVKVAA